MGGDLCGWVIWFWDACIGLGYIDVDIYALCKKD